MALAPLNLTGQWLDAYVATGIDPSCPLLVYADGGNFACALSATEPANNAYGMEAEQGEQLRVGGDGLTKVWLRATSGGSASVRVQAHKAGSAVPAAALPDQYTTSGTLSGNGDTVELVAPGCSGGLLVIDGTFQGRITLTGGTIDGNAIEGGRLLFRSGVGGIGRNSIDVPSSQTIAQEFRYVAGGNKVIARASNWVSGSATIYLQAQVAPTDLFINGPVRTAEEGAVRDERGFIADTGIQSVTGANALAALIRNPSDSGVNLILRRRKFSNDRDPTDVHLEYRAIGNPTDILANSGNGLNLRVGGDPSQAVFQWAVDTQANIGDLGGFVGTGEVLPNGFPYTRELEVVFPPGTGFGVRINGSGNNLQNAVRVGAILEWYEEATF